MNKIKPLRPTLRERKRYLVYEVLGDFSQSDVKKAIEENLFDYLGVKGMASVGLMFLDSDRKRGIIRISAKSLNDVKAGLLFLKKIGEKDASVKVLLVSGMIGKARKLLEV